MMKRWQELKALHDNEGLMTQYSLDDDPEHDCIQRVTKGYVCACCVTK